jgi:hypothetical protein
MGRKDQPEEYVKPSKRCDHGSYILCEPLEGLVPGHSIVTGLEGMHDLYAAVGAFQNVGFGIVFNAGEWMYHA